MSGDVVIEIAGLMVRYDRLLAVDKLSLEVPKGGVYALLGRNGSGKSSTVRCLIGQQRSTAGDVRLFGLDSWRKRRKAMARVGVVPETPTVPPETTANRLARFMARVTPRWNGEGFFSRLATFGIPTQHRFDRLSKGQKRQLSLALALSSSPELLVLDDPTLGLDAVARRELFEELIVELADRGTTVFLTTHDLAGVEGIADRVGVLKNGRLLVNEGLEGLKGRFRRLVWTRDEGAASESIEAGLQHVGVVGSNRNGSGTEAVVGGFNEIAFGRFRTEVPVDVAKVEPLSLEEIFIALCGEEHGGAI